MHRTPLSRRARVWAVLAGAAALCLAAGWLPAAHAATAAASTQEGYSVTVAARVCANFADISANRARNNLQESLKDLGPDTTYSDTMVNNPVVPTREDPANSYGKGCEPLDGVHFAFGTGISKGALQLSEVTGGSGASAGTTKATTPLLDQQGAADGDLAVKGAVTVPLDADQVKLAQSASTFWIQGGTPGHSLPAPDAQHRAYAFGALRCAVDDLNGDNVEWIQFPQGVKHVFCYAYYVNPSPEQAALTIVKHVTEGSGDFSFTSNASYEPDHTFGLTASADQDGSTTFWRAASQDNAAPGNPDGAYTVTESPTQGWQLAGQPACAGAPIAKLTQPSASAPAEPDSSSWVYDDKGVLTVHLAAGEQVTCTFTNQPAPAPMAQLKVSLVTNGAHGGPFTFTQDGSVADSAKVAAKVAKAGAPASYSATTLEAGTAVPVEEMGGALPAGTYALAQSAMPTSQDGTWSFTSVSCTTGGEGTPVSAKPAISVDLVPGELTECTFVDAYEAAAVPPAVVPPVVATPSASPTPSASSSPSATPDPVPAAGRTTSGLPKTGASLGIGLVAVVLVLAGSALVVGARRRLTS